MKKILMRAIIPAAAAGLATLAAGAAERTPKFLAKSEGSSGNLSLKLEIEHAIGKGLAWLEKQQNEDGSWGSEDYPALTGLALTAFMGNPKAESGTKLPPHVRAGYAFLLSKVQSDGGIYGKGLASYNTSINMMALLMIPEEKDLEGVVLAAREFLVNQQGKFSGEKMQKFNGGVGYGSTWGHSDLSNTHLALEALHYSRHLIEKGEKTAALDLDWDAAIGFVSRCQNLPETNPEAWASGDPKNKGGFVYFPGSSMAGEEALPGGKTALRSYGSMTYAGLLSFLYAEMDRDDPRVKATLAWLQENFSLKENPGMGEQGLFYYYHTMAKALNLAGVDKIKAPDGKSVAWREVLATRLFSLQQTDGSWVNNNGRWWEKDPVLVTAYAVLTLEHIHRGL